MRNGAEMSRKWGAALLAPVILSFSTVALAGQCGFDSLRRGDVAWTYWAGIGETHRKPSGTHVPHLDFGVTGLEYAKFVSPRSSVGYTLSLFDQTGDDNRAGSILAKRTHYFVARRRFAADCAFGLGASNLRHHVSGQATKWNFAEQLSLGLHYATRSNSAVVVEWRLCHTSNAGLKRPNHGINATTVSIGYSWYR